MTICEADARSSTKLAASACSSHEYDEATKAIAARANTPNEERDIHRIFKRHDLTLNIPITTTSNSNKHHTLHLASLLQSALEHKVINTSLKLLHEFWQNWRVLEQTHPVFSDHDNHLHECIPMLIHGDEGRGVKKKASLF